MGRSAGRRPRIGALSPPPLDAALGDRIRAARLRIGLTQADLGGERYTRAYVNGVETGRTKPSWTALRYLAERLGLAAVEMAYPSGRPVEPLSAVAEALALISAAQGQAGSEVVEEALRAAELGLEGALKAMAEAGTHASGNPEK